MTNFSIVSIPFCLLIANTVGIDYLFPAFYLCICVVGVVLAIIIARIPPISRIPDTYREKTGKQLNEEVPDEKNVFAYAVEMSCARAEKFSLRTVLSGGFEVVMGMLFDLIPIVAAWGTIALIIATYTPVFKWLSYPMGMYMSLFGVEEAFAVAPATLVGFADMFIPALLITGIASVKIEVYHWRAVPGADHLSDGGWDDYYQERDTTESVEAFCHISGTDADCHSGNRPDGEPSDLITSGWRNYCVENRKRLRKESFFGQIKDFGLYKMRTKGIGITSTQNDCEL